MWGCTRSRPPATRIRNVTADHFAGAAADEIEDPRPTAELIRQWSTDHPEFQFLPRKFKIAITGSPNDRAVTKAHDIGLRMVRNEAGAPGFEVLVGGGLGRTPMIGRWCASSCRRTTCSPMEAILRVYNLLGRRDNKFKARIKITGPRDRAGGIARNGSRRPSTANRARLGRADPAWWRDRGRFAPTPRGTPGGARCAAARRRSSAFMGDTNLTAHRAPTTPSSASR